MTLTELTDRLLEDLEAAFREALPQIRNAVLESGREFAHDMRHDLLRWQELAATGAISKEDLRWLVQSRADLAKLTALRDAGLARVRIDELRGRIARTIAGTVIDTVGL
ncbi:MAG: hypothetical protein HKN17_06080 [Rhodothermales bacterium]|nr:hypothetical protein [Rhodothermales bacterium]